MTESISLSSQKRTVTGSKVKQLRRESLIPANIFGKGQNSMSVQVNYEDFIKVYNHSGETGLIDLTVDSKKPVSVLISGIQYHPTSNKVIHVDFRQVDLTEKITTHVPVELIGEAPAEKLGAVIITGIDEIEVEALPGDLPESIKVDISALKEIGDNISIEALMGSVPQITILTESDTVIVSAQEVKQEAEVEESSVESETESETTVAEKQEVSE